MDALLALLDPDAVSVTDGGGIVSAATRPIVGAERVARFLVGLARLAGDDLRMEPVHVNGAPGVVASPPSASGP